MDNQGQRSRNLMLLPGDRSPLIMTFFEMMIAPDAQLWRFQ